MKKTLYQLVEAILNDMDADPVDAITDTFEAEQVAIIVRDTYFHLIDSRNWPHLKQFVTLEETSVSTPSHITLPDTVKELIHLKYNMAKTGETQRKYQPLEYLYPDVFLEKTDQRNNDNTNIDLITDPTGGELLIMNDKEPQWWTSFDDQTLVFDSYDSAVDTFVTAAKSKVYAYVTPVWVHTDAAVPDLPEDAFTLLLEEAKSTAFLTLKQMVNEKAETRSQKADAWLSRKAFVAKGGVRYPDYGRKRGTSSRSRPHPLEKDN